MLNFSYANPTRLVFGRSAEHEVGRVMTSILGRPGKVLVLFGGGSAHRTGILEAVEDSLQESGFAVIKWAVCSPIPGWDLSATRLTGCAIRAFVRWSPWAAVR